METLLGYAQLEQGKINFSVEPLNVADCVLNIVNDFYRDEAVIKISFIGEPLTVLADVEYFLSSMSLDPAWYKTARSMPGNAKTDFNLIY